MGRSFGSHCPYRPHIDGKLHKHLVMLLRSPTQQLYSMRSHSAQHHMGICSFLRSQRAFQHKQRPAGFQTQYLLGYNGPALNKRCKPRPLGPSAKVSEADGAYAALLIHQIGFIGITDFFEASACLLLEHVDTGARLQAKSLYNVRPSKRKQERRRKSLHKLGCPDHVDEVLFQYALDRFFSSLVNSSCFKYLYFTDLGAPESNRKLEYMMALKNRTATRAV